MGIVVIGAQASGAGKTGLICSLIAAMPERRWTAIKVTLCSHGITQCSHQVTTGKACDCELGGREFSVSEESSASGKSDTARYLAAGAARSLWMRTLPGGLAEAMPRIHEEIAAAEDVILESNSVLGFLQPDLYALIVSPCIAEFKPSARRYLHCADTILLAMPPAGHEAPRPAWWEELRDELARIQQFSIAQPQLASDEFVGFVRRHLGAAP